MRAPVSFFFNFGMQLLRNSPITFANKSKKHVIAKCIQNVKMFFHFLPRNFSGISLSGGTSVLHAALTKSKGVAHSMLSCNGERTKPRNTQINLMIPYFFMILTKFK